ncbi:MAG: LysR family substrate-binding domain-containing protein [Desertifilum sp.]|nr:LysR family substrate-binding domain-containing protein [Desertifilum sp.]
MNNSIANTILPEIVQEFRQRFPMVELELHEFTSRQDIQVQMLKNHQLDAIFSRSPSFEHNDPALSIQPILEEYFIVALPSTHALASQMTISLKALAEEAIILPSLDVLPFYEKSGRALSGGGFLSQKIKSNCYSNWSSRPPQLSCRRGWDIDFT